ncbi:amidinotransferase [Candidatus Saccharibacteria bacterium]|nr:amidinotransferase [Candidatus Saccharibacteria bacterium]
MNNRVLMSSPKYFDDSKPINPYMDAAVPVNRAIAEHEHRAIKTALVQAGIEVIEVSAPIDCQDGVYTANWALVVGEKAIMSMLPNARKAEEAYAEEVLQAQGLTIIKVPDSLRFSGQGDALPCGKYLLCGPQYRTDAAVHSYLAKELDYELIGLQTMPQLDSEGLAVINASSGWPDSFFYDIDLAISVLKPDLIAWCPDAFVPESQQIMRALPIDKIEVSLEEAVQSFACNLISTGETVIMSSTAPLLQAAIEAHGLKTITPAVSELAKGGGYIRCTTLTLS